VAIIVEPNINKKKMNREISHISIVVDDYDKAIEFYTKKLNFVLLEDTIIDETKRWVKIAPNKKSEFSLLLAKASNEIQKTRIGNQTGGRVFLFLNTNDFEKDYENLLNKKIKIIREPKIETYGKILVFEDCFGNLWDLIEPFEVEKEKFYSTGILKVIEKQNIEKTKEALIQLQKHTKNEIGNLTFEIQQSIENESEFLIWECFENETEFKKHLASDHLKDFLKLNLIEFIKGYATKKI
jgi:quinol monooxygenase YgiN/predicted enzyme related to lactoylglutathione lyase